MLIKQDQHEVLLKKTDLFENNFIASHQSQEFYSFGTLMEETVSRHGVMVTIVFYFSVS
jgi:hypothetical protein